MSGPSLDDFFARIRPLLLGEETPEQFEARLGPSASGVRRLAVYPRLVAGDLRSVMEALYPAVKVAAERVQPGSWSRLLPDFARAHPATHWDVNRFGEPFAAFLSAQRAQDPALPAFLEELADFHWTDYCAFVHEATEVPPSGVNPTAQVRQYGHAIGAWARKAAAGDIEGLPEAKPTTLIVYRDPVTLWTRIFYPNMAALFALARAQRMSNRALIEAAGVSEEDMDRAARHLEREGVLLASLGRA